MFNIIPDQILERYKTVEDFNDPDLTAFIAGAFGKLSVISHQAHHIGDPVAGQFFQWTHPEYPGLTLEVVGQLDGQLSMCLYKSHWAFNNRQTHLDMRVELIRAFLKLRGADLSRVEGLMMPSKARGRPVYTAELLTVELLRMLAKQLGKSAMLPAEPKSMSSGWAMIAISVSGPSTPSGGRFLALSP